jgi:galactonate dehydratase
MRIVQVEPLVVANTWKNWVFVLLSTDEGYVGVGEATLEHRTQAVTVMVRELAPKVVGLSPEDPAVLVERLRRETYTPGIDVHTVLAGYEMAMWDLVGKMTARPLYRLFGGALRLSVRAYANGWYRVPRTPEAFYEAARQVRSMGYTAVKFDPLGTAQHVLSPQEERLATELTQAVRQAMGEDGDIIVEGHGRLCWASALRLAERIAPFRPLWYEEPVAAHDSEGLKHFTRLSPVPAGVGERAVTLSEFRALLDLGPLGVLQPDVVHVGGMLRARQVAALAEAYGVPVAFHNAQGPITAAASLHLAATTPNAWLQETFADFDPPWTRSLVRPPLSRQGDSLAVPQGPGLGVDLDLEIAKEHPYDPASAQNLYAEGWHLRQGQRVGTFPEEGGLRDAR